MDRIEHSITIKGLAVSTAMAGALLSGCTTTAPNAQMAASAAQDAMAEGRHDRALRNAEQAVQADPQNAEYRAMLGKAYLDAGRFASAQTSFEDAMSLGGNSPRTALSLALSLTAQAKYSEAAALLNNWESEIAVADLGLALALSGQPERGIHQMSNAIRAGENTAKMRQNLAFAYAVAGRWREARIMASQDVPADKVSDRMQQWAEMASPLAYQQRVAGLLGVPANIQDEGQPVHLALSRTPTIEQIAAEVTSVAVVTDSNGELPAIDAPAEVEDKPAPVRVAENGSVTIQTAAAELPSVGMPATPVSRYSPPSAQSSSDFAQAFEAEEAVVPLSAPAPAPLPQMERETSIVFVSNPVIQQLDAGEQIAQTSTEVEDTSHLVQLGSFSSRQAAERAWEIYASRHTELANHQMVISEAVVNGRRYFRVSADGFSLSESRAMCAQVDAESTDGCVSWAMANPLPGAVDTGIQLASR